MSPDDRYVIRTLLTKKRVVIIVLAAVLLVGLLFVLDFISYGHIQVTGRSDISDSRISVEIESPLLKERLKLDLKPGEVKSVRVKKSAYRINASVGRLKSINVVTVRGRKTSPITLPNGNQHATKKVGSFAKYCPMPVGEQMYSYNCDGEGGVYKHKKLDSSSLDPRIKLFGGREFSLLQRVGDGLLGVQLTTDSISRTLVFMNPQTDTTQEVSTPGTVGDLLQQESPTIIGDSNKSHFLLVFTRMGAVYLFDNIGDKDPVKLTLPQNATLNDSFGITTFRFYGDRIVTYAGRADGTEYRLFSEDAKKLNQDSVPDYNNNIYEFGLDGRVVKTTELPKELAASDVYKVTDSFYAVQQRFGIELYHNSNGTLRSVYVVEDGTQPAVVDNTVYIVLHGTIYAFRGQNDGSFSLESVFSSPAIGVSGLFSDGDGLLFTASVNRSTTKPLDVYRLLEGNQTTPPLEETVDFEKLNDIITSYTFDDERIVFSLKSTGSGASGETLRSRLEAKLKERGIDVGSRRVELYPLN